MLGVLNGNSMQARQIGWGVGALEPEEWGQALGMTTLAALGEVLYGDGVELRAQGHRN